VTAAAGVSFCRIGSANDYAAAGAVQLKKLGQDLWDEGNGTFCDARARDITLSPDGIEKHLKHLANSNPPRGNSIFRIDNRQLTFKSGGARAHERARRIENQVHVRFGSASGNAHTEQVLSLYLLKADIQSAHLWVHA
jgi:hypothetical protein